MTYDSDHTLDKSPEENPCETTYTHYVVHETQGHTRKKYDPKLHGNFRNMEKKTLISFIPYRPELFHGLQNIISIQKNIYK